MQYDINLVTLNIYSEYGQNNCTDEISTKFATYLKEKAEQSDKRIKHSNVPGSAFTDKCDDFEKRFFSDSEYVIIIAYFESKNDAEIFSEELTTILVDKVILLNRLVFVLLGDVKINNDVLKYQPINFSTTDWERDEENLLILFRIISNKDHQTDIPCTTDSDVTSLEGHPFTVNPTISNDGDKVGIEDKSNNHTLSDSKRVDDTSNDINESVKSEDDMIHNFNEHLVTNDEEINDNFTLSCQKSELHTKIFRPIVLTVLPHVCSMISNMTYEVFSTSLINLPFFITSLFRYSFQHLRESTKVIFNIVLTNIRQVSLTLVRFVIVGVIARRIVIDVCGRKPGVKRKKKLMPCSIDKDHQTDNPCTTDSAVNRLERHPVTVHDGDKVEIEDKSNNHTLSDSKRVDDTSNDINESVKSEDDMIHNFNEHLVTNDEEINDNFTLSGQKSEDSVNTKSSLKRQSLSSQVNVSRRTTFTIANLIDAVGAGSYSFGHQIYLFLRRNIADKDSRKDETTSEEQLHTKIFRPIVLTVLTHVCSMISNIINEGYSLQQLRESKKEIFNIIGTTIRQVSLTLVRFRVPFVIVCGIVSIIKCVIYVRGRKSEVKHKKVKPNGLKNTAETCYMNSMVQALSSSTKLIGSLKSLPPNDNVTLFLAILQAINDPTDPEGSVEQTTEKLLSFMRTVKWNRSSQQDAFQLLSFFINAMQRELGGKTINMPPKVKLLHTFSENKSFNKVQDHLALAVPLVGNYMVPNGVDISLLLDAFFEPSDIDDGQYKTTMYLFEKPPEILILHIQANEWSNEQNAYIKPKYFIDYGPILKYKFKIQKQKDESELRDVTEEYKLMAVVHHMGGVSGGHYITYRQSEDVWYLTNDEQVEEVDFQCDVVPYIMVYEKI